MRKALKLLVGVSATVVLAAVGLSWAMRTIEGDPRPADELREVRAAVQLFIAFNDRVPRDRRDLVDDKIINASDLNDPWNRPLRVRCTEASCEIGSAGPDGTFGTSDDVLSKIDTGFTEATPPGSALRASETAR